MTRLSVESYRVTNAPMCRSAPKAGKRGSPETADDIPASSIAWPTSATEAALAPMRLITQP
jgi:hypothetical protein